MNKSWISRLAARMVGSMLAFLVALLPERIKEQQPFSDYQSDAAHFLSGITECATGLGLLVYGYDWYIGNLNPVASKALADNISSGAIHGERIGATGVGVYVLYLFHPLAILCMFMVFEGYIRAVSSRMGDRRHGISALWAICKICSLIRAGQKETVLRKRLGPYEPDSFFMDGAAQTLVVTCHEDKNWSERQVAQYQEAFFVLAARNFIREGAFYRHQ